MPIRGTAPSMMQAMTWRLDLRAFAAALLLFATLVALATLGARTGWLRGFFGDVLAVAWLHCVFRSVLAAPPLALAAAAFGTGCALELAQCLARLWHLRIANPVLRIVLGSTPDWMDVLAYALGFVAVMLVESALRAARPTACAPRSSRRGR